MHITITSKKYELTPQSHTAVEEKLASALKLLGADADRALLEVEIEEAPPEGRSATPCKLVARVVINDDVFHAEAVKPTPETAADRVRGELESSIRRSRGRTRRLFRRGGSSLKQMLRFGRGR